MSDLSGFERRMCVTRIAVRQPHHTSEPLIHWNDVTSAAIDYIIIFDFIRCAASHVLTERPTSSFMGSLVDRWYISACHQSSTLRTSNAFYCPAFTRLLVARVSCACCAQAGGDASHIIVARRERGPMQISEVLTRRPR